jgi:hypothetical protein
MLTARGYVVAAKENFSATLDTHAHANVPL